MGYYTHYKLRIDPPQTLAFVQELKLHADAAPWVADTWARDGTFIPNGGESTSQWRDEESEMRAASAAHPELLFTLDGNGEEQGDVWRSYYHAGKAQHWRMPTIKPDPFDATKLE